MMFDELAELERRGYATAHFSTSHPDNRESPWEQYFAPYLELGGDQPLGVTGKLLATARMFRNGAAASAMGRLLAEFRPELVHIHGIHRQLSPSVLEPVMSAGIPVVQTLHDFHHVCPADTLLRSGTTPCMPPECAAGHYSPAVSNRCMKDSAARSALSAAETWYQRNRRVYEKAVTRFLAPSRFMAEVMRSDGWEVPIDVVPNAVGLTTGEPPVDSGDDLEPYALYAGRLSHEKGVAVALEAAEHVGVRVVVAGEGPLEIELRERFGRAEFLGRVDPQRVSELLRSARAAVVPSLGLENASMSVLEAMAAGVPVCASRIGGIPEQVEDGATGFLSDPGSVAQMAESLATLFADAELAVRMGEAGQRRVESEFSPARHFDLLIQAYESAMGS